MAYEPLPKILTAALREGLEGAFSLAEDVARGSSEPTVVRTLGQEIVTRCDGLTPSGTRVTAEIDFIHQASYVSFLKGRAACRCEAGDLLVVSNRLTPWIASTRAVLFQAKLFSTPTASTVVPRGDAQHYLYHHWPTVQYTFGRDPGLTTRAITRDRRFQGSRYLLIPKRPTAHDRSSICVTQDNDRLGPPEPAPTYLLNMMRNHAAVPYLPGARGDWNGFVDDLRHRARRPSSAKTGGSRVLGREKDGETDSQLVVLTLTVVDHDYRGDLPLRRGE